MWIRAGRAGLLALGFAFASLLGACGGGGGGSPISPVAPTLTMTSNVSGEVRATFDLEFAFSEPPYFPTGTLVFSLTGGSVVTGSFKAVTDRKYSAQIKPNANSSGVIDLRVPAGAFKDASAQAANAVAYEFSQAFSTLLPFAQLAFSGPQNALGAIQGTGVFTVTFNTVLDAPLAARGLTVSNGVVSNFLKTSATGQPDTYTFTYTPPTATRGSLTILMPKGTVTAGGLGNDENWWTYLVDAP